MAKKKITNTDTQQLFEATHKEVEQEEKTMMENKTENRETLQNVENEQTVDAAFAEAVGLIPDELIEVSEDKMFERSTETVSIKTIVNRYKKGSIVIPACQRLYVWKQSDVDLLLDSINHNFPIGILMLGECNGKKWLLDGLQRLTSIVSSLNRGDITKEQKNAILEYRIVVETIRGMDMEDMNAFIQRCNMGVKMSAATKHRAGLPASLFDLVVGLAGKEAYRTLKVNRTFTTGAHNELIAMHSLLTAAKLFGSKNTASELCKRMKAGEDLILEHKDEADRMVSFVTDAFVDIRRFLSEDKHYMERDIPDIADHLSVKGLNVNFVSAIFRIMMKHPELTQRELQEMILHIFEGTKALREYSSTTARNASDERNMVNRLAYLEQLLCETREQIKELDTSKAWSFKSEESENDDEIELVDSEVEVVDAEEINAMGASKEPDVIIDIEDSTESKPEHEMNAEASDAVCETSFVYDHENFIELESYSYSKFCVDYDKEVLHTTDNVVSVPFTSFSDDEKKQLYMAIANHDTAMLDNVIAQRGAVLELTQE